MKAYIFLAEGFEDIEAVAVIDVLRRAKIDIKSVSITAQKEVTSAHGVMINTDMLFDMESLKDGELLILPGGMPGTANLAVHSGLASLIEYYYEKDKYLAAICAAPTILGKIGILDAKTAACYPGYENDLGGAVCKSDSVVQDGKIITSRGPGTAIEFSLKLVEVLRGSELSCMLRKGMLA